MIVCILGMHRSGTSMITRLLNLSGLYLGPDDQLMLPEKTDNPEGYWENNLISGLNDDILQLMDGTWNHPPVINAGWSNTPEYKLLAQRFLGITADFNIMPAWGWKDPRNSLTLELWLKHIPDLKLLLCVRNPVEVVQSLGNKKNPLRQMPPQEAFALWQTYHESILKIVDVDQLVVTHYDSYFYDPVAELRRVTSLLGMETTDAEIEAATRAIKRDLKRNVFPNQLTTEKYQPASVVQYYRLFTARAGEVFKAMQADEHYQLQLAQGQIDRLYSDHLEQIDELQTERRAEVDNQRAHYEAAMQEQARLTEQHINNINQQHAAQLDNQRVHYEAAMQEQARLTEQHIDNINQQHTHALAELQGAIKELEATAHQLKRDFTAEEERIRAEHRRMLADQREHYEKQLTAVHTQFQQRDQKQQQMIQSLQLTAQDRQAVADHFEQRLVIAERDLWKIHKSRSWRMVQRWWRFQNRLFPPGSAHRAVLVTLTREGPFALINRSIRYIGGERRYKSKTQQAALPTPVHTNGAAAPQVIVPYPASEPASPIETAPFLIYKAVDPTYQRHITRTEPTVQALYAQMEFSRHTTERFMISIVTPVYKTPIPILKETVRSVREQTYPEWEWLIVDASPDDETWHFLQRQAAEEPRIRLVRARENKGISANTNLGLQAAQGDYIALLDHDDTLAAHALYEIVTAAQHTRADLIFSDEDKLDEQGYRCEPFFKPDWSPAMMLCVNSITHLAAFRRELLDTVGYLDSSMDGAQDWDLFLRIGEQTQNIHHIPKVLYHWRKTPQSTAQARSNKSNIHEVQGRAVNEHLKRLGLLEPETHFTDPHKNFINSIYPLSRWQQRQPRTISIIIPSRDHADVVGPCLRSIFELTTYDRFEVILVDTGSVEQATFNLYARYEKEPRFKVVAYEGKFNFSRACNVGAQVAEGDLLLFLNNDTEVLHADWLDLMAQWFEFNDVGIVGSKLVYPDGKIQHAGVVVGMGGLASHLFIQEKDGVSSMLGSDNWYRDMLAVTGACLMISRKAYDAVKGFDELYLLNYSDIELCVRVVEAGYRVVYTPAVQLKHYESVTHGRRIPRNDFERAGENWIHWLRQGDPYFNPNLSYMATFPMFNRGGDDSAYGQFMKLMRLLPQKEIIVLPDDIVNAELQEQARIASRIP